MWRVSDNPEPDRSVPSRRRVLLLAVAVLSFAAAVLSLAACSDPPRCETGLCPASMSCAMTTGLCQPDPAQAEQRMPLFRGEYSLIALPGLRYAVVGYAVEHKSLVWLEQGQGVMGTAFLAGPAAGDSAGPEGARSTAVSTPAGVPHVAWMRSLDQTMWYATRRKGKWQRELVSAVPPNRAGQRMAIALRAGQPTIAFEDAIDGGISIASRDAAGKWRLATLPAPSLVAAAPVVLGGTLALSGAGGGLALATYDSAGGDLILASRGPSGWETARFAGRHAATGADDGDVGLPCALARDVGGELIVAWRHRTDNAVWVARSQGGEVIRRQVSDGSHNVTGRAIERRRIIGTAVAVTVRSDGRIAVAMQDASRARVIVAVETATGTFKRYQVPATGRPQVRPKLLARVDGSLVVTWLELERGGAGAARPATWTLNISGETP